ncbi:MAG: hypothetical protein ACRDVG_09320, partial [Jatrophihabitantaceae bacterium]
MPDQHQAQQAVRAPWVLLDEHCVEQTVDLLERLTDWLTTCRTGASARHATMAISLGETDDPISIASWADALAARLRQRINDSQL